MSSTTTDTIVLDAETPYNGNPTVASGLIVGCCSGRFHNMVLDINMDNGSDSDMRGLMILNAEVELCGSVKRCAKTSGTASTAYRYMASNEGRDGAGVHLYYASIKGNMDVFNNYTDTGNGGGIFGLNCHFEFGDIFNNSATDQGGGICAKSSVVQLASSGRVRNVYNNSVTSVGFGGGIYVDYAYATVMGNIRNNSVGNGYGGGLCVGHGGVAVQGDLTYNHGGYGGGFAVMSGGAVYVNGEVRYNDGAQGGGFYINGYSIAHVGIITDNISTTGGGAFYLASSCVVLFAYVNNNSSSSGYDVDGSSGNSVLTGVVSATDTLNPAFSVNTNLLKLT
jgi:predicted outer membrane repeat protein